MPIEEETKNEGTIADIIAQGYELKGRIIRPAQVTVIRNVNNVNNEKEDIDVESQNNSSETEGDNNG